MTYEQALEKINNRLVFGIKPGLERISALLEKLGDPQKKLKFVHVAGTNGKGTCSTLTASVLRESGYITGLYTSPYVLDFRERFQINGEMIPKDELIAEVEAVSAVAERMEAAGETITEFEFITAMALHWFAARGCDIVVLEVGLGGRFDATNVIDAPEAAAIMSISLDHTAILGDTVEKIAFEKAGIIKPGGRVVLYPQQEQGVREVIEAACRERGAEFIPVEMKDVKEGEKSLDGTDFQIGSTALHTPFLGEHQVKNACTAFEVIKVLRGRGFDLPDEKVGEGFKKAKIPARMEVLTRRPLCILDGGHNPGCAKALKEALIQFVPGKKIAVIGMMADKDSRAALEIIGPLFEKIVTVTPDNPRAMPARELAETAKNFCPNVYAAETCGEAVAAACKELGRDDALIVCGSFYLAGEIREPLQGKMENLQLG